MLHIEKLLITKRLLKAVAIFIRYSTFLKLINLLRVELERMLGRTVICGKPYFIKIQPTNICNAGCKYCLRNETSGDMPIGKMKLSDSKIIIDKLKKYAYLIGFQYSGEPLCNESICQIISYAHGCNIGTYLSTNLQEARKDDLNELVNCGLDLLTVAIDGISDATYGRYRERSDLAAVISNMRGLVEAKRKLNRLLPFMTLQFLVMKHNQHEIEGARKLAKEIGFNNIEFKPIGTNDKSLLPENAELLRRAYMKNAKLKRRHCWWLWGGLVILWDGRVLPCCHIVNSKTKLNILNAGISPIINNSFNQSIRNINKPDVYLEGANPCLNCVIPYGNILQQTI